MTTAPFRRLIFEPVDIRAHARALAAKFQVGEDVAWAALQRKLADKGWTDGKWIVTEHEVGNGVTHLAIHRKDHTPDHDWHELQRIKSAIAGPHRWGAELYPDERFLVDMAHQYHLWVLRQGQLFPFGFFDGRMIAEGAAAAYTINIQRRAVVA